MGRTLKTATATPSLAGLATTGLLIAGLVGAVPAFAQDVKRMPPMAASLEAPDLAEIGRAHSLAVRNDTLYVGASGGLAAIDATGKLKWTLKLPAVSSRHVEADADHVAYTSYDVVGLVAGGGAAAVLTWGDNSRKLEISSADAGLVTLQGEPVWSVKFEEPSALSVPTLGKTAVAVVGAKSMRVLDRAKGTKSADVGMFTNWLGVADSNVTRVAATPALLIGDEFVAAHQSWFKKVDAKGEEVLSVRAKVQHTAGPMSCKGALLIGESAYPQGNIFTGKKARFWAIGPKGEEVWKATIDDEAGGVGSLACNDELIFAASNAIVVAVDGAGKQVWEATNDRSGRLFPGTYRGVVRVRDIFNNAGPAVARSVTAGRQMLVAGPYLYITTRSAPDVKATEDVITVLDAKSGAFVAAYEVKTSVIDMAVFGKDLVLATGDGLKLIGLKQ